MRAVFSVSIELPMNSSTTTNICLRRRCIGEFERGKDGGQLYRGIHSYSVTLSRIGAELRVAERIEGRHILKSEDDFDETQDPYGYWRPYHRCGQQCNQCKAGLAPK